MRRSLALFAGLLLLGAVAAPTASASASASASSDAAGDHDFTIKDPRIKESSGLAASRLHPGIYWTHNDSDDGPYIYAVDSRTGKTVATVTLSGVGRPRDAEAISVGPGNQIYVGDIGDNLDGSWPYVWIYRLSEPKVLKDQTIPATQYVVKYSNGARNAESLVVHPKTGRVYIIDKKENGGHLYEGPAHLSTSKTNIFRPIAPIDLWTTDAAFSPNGRQLAVRGYFGGAYYDWNGGKIVHRGRLDVPLQQQGESITYSVDATKLLYGSEGSWSPVAAEDAPPGAGQAHPKSSSASGSSAEHGLGIGAFGGSLKSGAVALAVIVAGLIGLRGLRRVRRRG